jgi:GNAT superfamily N-acetyltransferase
MQIRRYHDRDRDAVMALAPRLTAGVAPWRRSEAVAAAVRAWVDGSLKSQDVDDRPVFVAEDAGRIVGFATAATRKHWSGDIDAYIGELAVAEDCTTRGIGRALVAAIETWARSFGHNRVTLETGASNSGGRAFYAALGYTAEEVVLTRDVAEQHPPS